MNAVATPDRVAAFVDTFPGDRAAQVHQALTELATLAKEHRLVIAELTWEVRRDRLWQKILKPGGGRYATATEYLRAVVDLRARSTREQYMRIGRMLHRWPAGERAAARAMFLRVSMEKLEMLAPIIAGRPKAEVAAWIERAETTDKFALRRQLAEEFPRQRAGSWSPRHRLHSHLSRLGVQDADLIDRFCALAPVVTDCTEPGKWLARALTDFLRTHGGA